MKTVTLYTGGATVEVIDDPLVPPEVIIPPEVITPPSDTPFAIGDQVYRTLDEAMAALKDGETLTIAPGGPYPGGGYSTASNITIQCVGGEAVFNQIYKGAITQQWGKSTFVLFGDNVTVSNIAGVNIVNSSQNGGLIRYDPPGTFPKKLVLNNIRVDRCQTGILIGNGQNAHVTINGITGIYNAFPYNEYTDWHSHCIYQGVGGELYINNADVRFTLQGGHLIKSRATKTVIRDSILIEGAGMYSDKNVGSSRALDISNGGVLEVTNTYIRQSSISDNPAIIGYGPEMNLVIYGTDDSTATDWQKHWTGTALEPGWSWMYSIWPGSAIHIDSTVHCWDYRTPAAGKIVNNGVPYVRPQPSPIDDQGSYNVGVDPYPPDADPKPLPPPTTTEDVIAIVRGADGKIDPAWWANLPKGRWLGLANTSPMEQLKPLLRAGYRDFGTNPIDASSNEWMSLFEAGGGGGAEYRKPLLVGTGGGHNNSSNNGVYEFNTDTMQWRWRAQPSTDTYLTEDNVPSGQKVSDYWQGWDQNATGTTKAGKAITPRFAPNYFSVGWNGDDETKDHQAGSVHSYASLCVLPNGDFICSYAYHYWTVSPSGVWKKGGANHYDPDTAMQTWNGKTYRFGRIDGNNRILRYDPVTMVEENFYAKTTNNTWDDRIGFGGLMQVNWVEPDGKLYFQNGAVHADLTHPTLGCTYTGITGPFAGGDSSGAYHSVRKRAYALGWGAQWGKLFEIDSTSGTPAYTQIASTISVPQPQFPTNKRLFCDETLDCLFLAAFTGRNVQVYRL